ncbi:MAG: hypothetical protein JSS81_19625 [Acidobacteria bacterium]|nr:hypothetical protein [Acidobacteriota bacterium]
MSNYETVTIILSEPGTDYNPSSALIRLPALLAKLDEAKAIVAAVNEAQGVKTLRTDELQTAFEDFDAYIVDIKRTVAVELDDEALNHDLQSIVNRGRRPAPKAKPSADAGPPARTRSISRGTYDDRIAILADIHALLKARPEYRPTGADAEFSTEAIGDRVAFLTAALNAARAAEAALGNLQEARARTLYDEKTGLVKLVKLVKTHFSRRGGRQKDTYRRLVALEFRKFGA